MTHFLAALLVFLALHIVPARPALRGRLIGVLGRRTYLAGYSVISTLVLAWVFYAAFQLDYMPLWDTQPWQAWAPLILTPLGLFFLIAGLLTPNPLSVGLRHGEGATAPGAILTLTRHPVLWGFMLWSGSHLVPNGDVRSLILFGVLFVFAALGIPVAERRAKQRLGQRWAPLAAQTSIVPFAAILGGRARLRVDGPVLIALAVTGVLTAWLLAGGHAIIFGADPLLLVFA